MRICEIKTIVNASLLTPSENSGLNIQYAFSSDMMSDVLAYAQRHMMLITGLANPQTIRTAEMLDIGCVLYVRGKRPADTAISLAEKLGITVLGTELTMFETSGLLYQAGIRGGNIKNGK
ncbi:DRTGG domain [uncultured Roseburia sp.]|uniref:DRTGG domain-containing protein n=1 Tax=Brotonthovivens ammoniilytica TaxID=2981725 RepID=A0ABT2TI31_9FIRM|nr:DRTGG domain-containing protein [Brotonthovivens ammoniilytica]MCU6761312.1 DRTGG domain-containing protein [Brotonthovivens ammoniilytica]SCI24987.1 DRTGG domain [uncultured Roseburia sp.]